LQVLAAIAFHPTAAVALEILTPVAVKAATAVSLQVLAAIPLEAAITLTSEIPAAVTLEPGAPITLTATIELGSQRLAIGPAGTIASPEAQEFAATATIHSAQHREASLLRVVETFVERVHRVGEFPERRAGFRHDDGALAHTFNRIVRPRLPVARRISESMDALEPLLGKLAGRLFERRPVTLLLGGQHQTGP
jgi:hypothetical protein